MVNTTAYGSSSLLSNKLQMYLVPQILERLTPPGALVSGRREVINDEFDIEKGRRRLSECYIHDWLIIIY